MPGNLTVQNCSVSVHSYRNFKWFTLPMLPGPITNLVLGKILLLYRKNLLNITKISFLFSSKVKIETFAFLQQAKNVLFESLVKLIRKHSFYFWALFCQKWKGFLLLRSYTVWPIYDFATPVSWCVLLFKMHSFNIEPLLGILNDLA